jgi:hypothetical protein
MLLGFSINEGTVFEIGFGRTWVLKFGNFEVVLHRAYPGDDAAFSWETRIVDHPASRYARPWRCHDTTAQYREWELVVSRSYPIPGTVPLDPDVDDEGKSRPWTAPGYVDDEPEDE